MPKGILQLQNIWFVFQTERDNDLVPPGSVP